MSLEKVKAKGQTTPDTLCTTPTAATNSKCSKCTKTVSSKSKALSCFSCDQWCHRYCDKTVTVEVYNFLAAHPTEAIQYVCTPCRRTKLGSDNRLSTSLDRTENEPGQVTDSCEVAERNLTLGSPNQTIIARDPQTSEPIQVSTPMDEQNATNNLTFDLQKDIGITVGLKPSAPIRTEKPRYKQAKRQKVKKSRIENKERTSCKVQNPASTQLPTQPGESGQKTKVTQVSRGTSTPAPKQDNSRYNSVIIFGVSESTEMSLRARDKHDEYYITSVLLHMGVQLNVFKHHRLNNKGASTNSHESRPIRLETEASGTASQILARSPMLHSSDWSHIRIRRDLPWSERQSRRQNAGQIDNADSRSIIIRGVPETQGKENGNQHDSEQWDYILEKSRLTDILAERVIRLPRPVHLSTLPSPRLIKVVLFDEDMKHRFLQSWRKIRHTFATAITCHESRPRAVRAASREIAPSSDLIPALNISPIRETGAEGNPNPSSETSDSKND